MKQKFLLLYSAFFLASGVMSAADDIIVAPAAGSDIAAAIAEAKAGHESVGNITVNLAADAAYTLSASIETGAGLAINGNGSTIDASALEAPFILMSATPAVEAINDYYRVDAVTISGVTVNNLKNSILYDNNTKYCVVNLSIDNSVFALATTAVQYEALIAFQSGGAKDFTIKNSTVYGNGEVAKYFIRYNNSARLDRYGFDKNTEFQVMDYQDNTFYNLLKADGQWGNYSAVQGQNYVKFIVRKNIWFDCGKDIIRRMAGGRFGGSAPLDFAYNTYFNDGEDISASEATYDKSGTILTSNPGFADAPAGNFTIGSNTQQAEYQTGASRWLVAYDGGQSAIEGIESDIIDAPVEYFNLQGMRVDNPSNGVFIRRQGSKVSKVIVK